jgi:hypothetical protein
VRYSSKFIKPEEELWEPQFTASQSGAQVNNLGFANISPNCDPEPAKSAYPEAKPDRHTNCCDSRSASYIFTRLQMIKLESLPPQPPQE